MKLKIFLVVIIVIMLFVIGYAVVEAYVRAIEFVGKAYGVNVISLEYLYDSALCIVFFILYLVIIAILLLVLFAVILEEDL